MEQVDQFIENYFDGSIITPLGRKDIQLDDLQFRALVTVVEGIGRDVTASQILGDLTTHILDYSRRRNNPTMSSSPETVELAVYIFGIVIAMRHVGVLQNNPENPKMLDFFKARTSLLEAANAKLEEKLKVAYQTIQELELRLGEKAKGSKAVA